MRSTGRAKNCSFSEPLARARVEAIEHEEFQIEIGIAGPGRAGALLFSSAHYCKLIDVASVLVITGTSRAQAKCH